MKITLTAKKATRLDRFVREELPFLRRSFVQKLFRKREVKTGKVAQKPEAKISANSAVDVFLPDPRKYFSELTGNEIIFENADLIAFGKRAGISTHAGIGTRGDDLKNCAKALLKLNLTVVHRIDKQTSGIVVFAKNQKTARLLEEEFRRRRVGKKYFAMVEGIPKTGAGEIDLRLKRSGKVVIVAPDGDEAKTNWKLIRKLGKRALLEVEIETGRMHQIRVHLAAIGHPVVGDSVYGNAKEDSRMLLHAGELRILDYRFGAKIPDEFIKTESEAT